MLARDESGRHAHVGPGRGADEEKTVMNEGEGFPAEDAHKAVTAALRPFRVVVARNDIKRFGELIEDLFRLQQLRIRTEFGDVAREDDKIDPGLPVDIRYGDFQVGLSRGATDVGVGDESELKTLSRRAGSQQQQ